MIQVRNSCFETNSSSTHSLIICTKEEYEGWKEGKLLYDLYEDRFIDNYLLSEEKKLSKLREYYDSIKKDFYKDFNDLSKEEIRKLSMQAVESGDMFSDVDSLEDSDTGCYTYSGFWGRNNELEAYEEFYTSKSGDEIVIFGEYGYN